MSTFQSTRISVLCMSLVPISACVEYNVQALNVPSVGGDTLDGIEPVAICRASPNPARPLLERVVWDGSESFDPEGRDIVDYQWSLVQVPQGSQSLMPVGSNPRRQGFIPDLAGTYTGQLVVVTEDGRASQPCEVDLDSVPSEDLWIEMVWSEPGDDMDLHLLAPGGTLESNRDCYYMNCVDDGYSRGLDWGVQNNELDDPHLDLDDIEGFGPENINIAAPNDGMYQIVVHDFPGSAYPPDNNVTVRIYIMGEQVWEGQRTIRGEDTFTPIADIRWPEGEITER